MEVKHDIYPGNYYEDLFERYGWCCDDPLIEIVSQVYPREGLAYQGKLLHFHCLICGMTFR